MLPEMILDSDSFENLIEEYRSRIAGIYPDWTDYNYHDPGMTLLELFAWLRENQQYFLEQLGPIHYREFFRLAGFDPLKRQPARVLAEVNQETLRRAVLIPAGTAFYSGGVPYETVTDEYVPDSVVVRAEQLDRDGNSRFFVETGQLKYHGELYFSPFGKEPETGDAMQLTLSRGLKEETVYRLALDMKDNGRNPAGNGDFQPLSLIRWEYRTLTGFKELTVLADETRGLLYPGRITFRLEHGAMAGNGPELRAVLTDGGYDVPPVLTGISLSQIELVQVKTFRSASGTELPEGTGFPGQRIPLPAESVLAESIRLEAEDVLNPGRMLPWERVEDLFSCGPSDRCFEVDENTGTLVFGDGWHGMPPEGRILLKEYSECSGAGGNLKERAGFTSREAGLSGVVFTLTRVLFSGRDPETQEETLLRILKNQNQVFRAVTLEDFERHAMETPGLCVHSCCAWTENGDPKTVHLTVRPGTGERPLTLTEREKDAVLKHLEERRLIGTRIRLHSPRYFYVDVVLEFLPEPHFRNSAAMAEEEIRSWFGEKTKLYGRPLSFSELFGRLEKLPCLRRLLSLSLSPKSVGVKRNQNQDLVPPVNGVFLPGSIEVILNHYQADGR